jgi:hypothetical protein
MVMGFIANKRIKVGEEWREPGEPVPEAEFFPNLDALLRSRLVREGAYPEGYVVPEIDPDVLNPHTAYREQQLREIQEANAPQQAAVAVQEPIQPQVEPVGPEGPEEECQEEMTIESLLDLSVKEVLSAMEGQDSDTIEAVMQAEELDSNRPTLVSGLQSMLS